MEDPFGDSASRTSRSTPTARSSRTNQITPQQLSQATPQERAELTRRAGQPSRNSTNSIDAPKTTSGSNQVSKSTGINPGEEQSNADLAQAEQTKEDQQAAQVQGFISNFALLVIKWDELSDKEKAQSVVNLAASSTTDEETSQGVADLGSLIIQIDETVDNWDQLNDKQKANAAIQIYASADRSDPDRANIATASNLATNWDELSDSQRAVGSAKLLGDFVISSASQEQGFGSVTPLSTIDDLLTTFGGKSFTEMYGDAFGSSKDRDQKIRDAIRDFSTENLNGLLSVSDGSTGVKKGDHQIQLSDGSYYDIGVDGGAKIDNFGANVDGKDQRNAFDIDWSDPRTEQAVGALNPIAAMFYGKSAPRFMGPLLNAAMSNNNSLSETVSNIKTFAQNAGLTYEIGLNLLQTQVDAGIITQDIYQAYVGGWQGVMLGTGFQEDVVI